MKKIFAILTTCLLLASCAQFTELQPKGMNLLSTVDELELLLNAELEGPTSDMKRMCGDMISYANIPNELASPTPSRYTIMLTWDESKIETFNDIYLCPLRNHQGITFIVEILFDGRLTANCSAMPFIHSRVVNIRIHNGKHLDFDRSCQRLKPYIRLLLIGNDRTTIDGEVNRRGMTNGILQSHEVHITLLADVLLRHERIAEIHTVKVGDSHSVVQTLLIEGCQVNGCLQGHIRKISSVDIRLDSTQITILIGVGGVRCSCEATQVIIVSTRNSQCSCSQHHQSISKNLIHILSLLSLITCILVVVLVIKPLSLVRLTSLDNEDIG